MDPGHARMCVPHFIVSVQWALETKNKSRQAVANESMEKRYRLSLTFHNSRVRSFRVPHGTKATIHCFLHLYLHNATLTLPAVLLTSVLANIVQSTDDFVR